MNLYLIRHSVAEGITFGKKDYSRDLTKDGEVLIRNAAGYWKNIIPGFDKILTSPYNRAVQTAEIISSVFGNSNKPIVENTFSPGSTTSNLIDTINEAKVENIACVGHQPDLSNHISSLISNSGCQLHFPPGSIAKIRFNGIARFGKGELIYLIPPEVFK